MLTYIIYNNKKFVSKRKTLHSKIKKNKINKASKLNMIFFNNAILFKILKNYIK